MVRATIGLIKKGPYLMCYGIRHRITKYKKKIENVESDKMYSCRKTKGTINKIKEQATHWERCLVCKQLTKDFDSKYMRSCYK